MQARIIIASLALIVIAACTKNETMDVSEDRVISYNAIVNKPSTKVLINGTEYKPEDNPTGFVSSAYMTGENFVAGEAGLYINKNQVTYETSSGHWTTDTPYYWPKVNYLTFFSYSPAVYYLNNVTTITPEDGVVIQDWNVDQFQTVDIMVADRVTARQNPVSTVFRHKLAQIVGFSVKTEEIVHNPVQAGDLEIYLRSISVSIYTQGTYTSGNDVRQEQPGKWTDKQDFKTYLWWHSDTGVKLTGDFQDMNSNYDYILVLPQEFTGERSAITIEYSLREYYADGDAIKYTKTNPPFIGDE